MAETLNQAFKDVNKFADSIGKKHIEVAVIRASSWDGRETKPDTFKAYVPDCGYQDGETIAKLVENLDTEYTKRGRPVDKAETEDLPF